MKPLSQETPRANRLAALFEPATVVLFAGLGGVCIGVEQAYVEGGYRDKYIDLCVNHWDKAVSVHELNHPMTQHLHADVWEVDPATVLPGRKIAYLHASPDCTDFSKAKGGKPKRKHIRALADVVLVWAGKRRPDVITLENVEEFLQWGPLDKHDQPDKARRGEEFQRWAAALRSLGYAADWKELRACDYGAPTTRKRLFVIARRDDKTIVWPKKTHGPGTKKPFRTAAECIDWSIPMLSIFATPAEAKEWAKAQNVGKEKHERIGVPRRPLKAKTLERIARGLDKFVLKAKRSFIIRTDMVQSNSGCAYSPDVPLTTVTSATSHAAVDVTVAPFTAGVGGRAGQSPATSVDRPVPTVTAKGDRVVAAASLVRFNSEKGQEVRGQRVDAPLSTLDTQNRHGLALATLQTLNHGGDEHRAQSPDEPLHTVTGARDARALVAALVTKHYGNPGYSERPGAPIDVPLSTVTAADHNAVTCAYLSQLYGTNKGTNGDVSNPAPAVTGSGLHSAVVSASAVPFIAGAGGAAFAAKPKAIDEPANTVMVNDRRTLVAAFLAVYYSQGSGKTGQPINEPAPTVTSKDRIQLVTVTIDGQTYVVTDIAMRMLHPRELARAQGFPESYVIDRDVNGKPISKADQVKLIGNSVPPQFAQALAMANVVDLDVMEDAREAVPA